MVSAILKTDLTALENPIIKNFLFDLCKGILLNFKEYRYLIKGIIIVLRELILFLKIGYFKLFENELFELRKSKTLSTTRQYSTVASTSAKPVTFILFKYSNASTVEELNV